MLCKIKAKSYIPMLALCLLMVACGVNNEESVTADMEEVTGAVAIDTIDYVEVPADETEDSVEEVIDIEKQIVVQSWEDFEADKYPVLAAVPDRGIYLYTKKSDGIILRISENEHEYNWNYLTPRFILPSMQVHDYDGDGIEELAIILNVGSGTGISVYELHMVDISDEQGKEPFDDHIFLSYQTQLEKDFAFATSIQSGELVGELTAGTKMFSINLSEFQDEEFGEIEERIIWGSIVNFELKDNKIVARLGVGLVFDNVASPQYAGYVYADVLYKEGEFILTNYHYDEY